VQQQRSPEAPGRIERHSAMDPKEPFWPDIGNFVVKNIGQGVVGIFFSDTDA